MVLWHAIGHENLLPALYDQFLNPLLTDQGGF